MLHINPDKSLVQQPLRLEKPDASIVVEMPYGWLTQLGMLVADDILKLSGDAKADFLAKLESKAGVNSSYTLKAQLHESLIVIYVKLASAKTSPDQKMALALKLAEGLNNCTPGFHDRINEAVASLVLPENIDELLSAQRHSIVSNAASQESEGEVHAHNRFFVLARNYGYGVRPLNAEDIYHGALSDEAIKIKLEKAFGAHYAVFQILNALQEQLASLVRGKGYTGKRAEGYTDAKIYREFDANFLKPFLSITNDDLFLYEDDEDGITWKIVDIHWANVKSALLKKMRAENYFIFTPQEEALLKSMEDGKFPQEFAPEALSLFTTPSELVEALIFFKESPTDIKTELVHFYLRNTKSEDQNILLEKIEKSVELYKELQSDSFLQHNYLAKAVRENKLDKVRALVASGADINPHLVDLVRQHKNPVLQWLMNDAVVRATITRECLHAIAETLIHSKKGRQILLADERLRGMCPEIVAGKSLNEWMQQAKAEKEVLMKEGFFAPVNPLVQQLLQHIIYGEQAQAEKILKDHPRMTLELLTTKSKVKDYSGRKIFGTALQLALGAEDVRYHENEICMVEMLTPYIKSLPDGEKLMAAQIAEQFPEGYEEQEKLRIAADEAALRAVVDAIEKSANDAECEAALQTFYEYLKPKGVIKTGKHFYTQLLELAFALYDQKYDEFGGWDSRKNNMFWRKVIGHTQRYLPACYAQAFCLGLYDIVTEGKKLSRSLEFQYDKGVKFFPLDLNRAFRLGVDYAARGGRCGVGRAAVPGAARWRFTKLCQTKNKNIGTTYAAARETIRQMRGNVATF